MTDKRLPEDTQPLIPLSFYEAVEFWSVPVAIGLLLLVGAIAMFW